MLGEKICPDDTISLRDLATFLDSVYLLAERHYDTMNSVTEEMLELQRSITDFSLAVEKMKADISKVVRSLTESTKVATDFTYHLASIFPKNEGETKC